MSGGIMPRRKTKPGPDEADIRDVLRRLVATVRSPARIVELYYWSQERHLRDLMRAFVMLPPRTQEILLAFLQLNTDPEQIVAAIDADGRVILSSPALKELQAMAGSGMLAEPSRQTH
jgi:hypothetical protein